VRGAHSGSFLLAIAASATVLVATVLFPGCRSSEERVVVIYTALDRAFSEPILNGFQKQTGIRVLAKYDTEATKTVGLVSAIRAEKDRPRCDVFWNNEIVNTVRLQKEGLLEPYQAIAAKAIPPEFRDPEGYWCGFAARGRVLIVNTNLVAPAQMPDSIYSLADATWKGKTGIAKPLFGTTATHAACLFAGLGREKAEALLESFKKNDVKIQSGNKTVALNVSAGVLAFGLTDTDDAIGEVEAGKPVVIVYPDSRPDQMGMLFIPNTLALIRNAPHGDAGRQLIEYLLSPDVEGALARAESSQIPLNPEVKVKARVKTPSEVKPMTVDFLWAAEQFDEAAAYVEKSFLK